MPKPGKTAALAPISQMAFVPSDFEGAITYWTEKMGVGPFFLFENIALDDMKYRGKPTEARFTVAIAYWGDVQIELVKGENDAPAHYNGEYAVTDRLNHVLQFVDDFDASMRAVEEVGGEVIVSGGFGGGKVAYVDLGGGPGTLVEIMQPGEGAGDLFDLIKQAGIDWDGSDPVRKLG